MNPNARRVLRGHLAAPTSRSRDSVIGAYAYLAIKTASRYTPPGGYEMEDLVQSGIVGLIYAVDRFDPEAGASFETFAIGYVRGAIKDFCRRVSPASRGQQEASSRLRRAEEQARSKGCFSDASVAQELGCSLDELYSRYFVSQSICGGMLPLSDGATGRPLEEVLVDLGPKPEEVAIGRQIASAILREAGLLPKSHGFVLRKHYVEGWGFDRIAGALGLTIRQVRYLHRAAITKMRELVGEGNSPPPVPNPRPRSQPSASRRL